MAAVVEVVNESISVSEATQRSRLRTQVVDEDVAVSEATQGSRLRRQIVDEDLSIVESIFSPEEIWTTSTISSKPSGRIRYVVIEQLSTDGSEKELVFDNDVASGAALLVDSIRLEIVASGTAGTRTFVVEIVRDGAILRHFAVGTATVGQTKSLDPNLGENFRLLPGEGLRIADDAAIDPTGDDMLVKIRGRIEK